MLDAGKRRQAIAQGTISLLNLCLRHARQASVYFKHKLFCACKPVSNFAALFAPRMKSAAAVSSASENAICATTSGLRGKKRQRRRTTSSPACSFKSPMTELRESFRAGPSAKQIVPIRQKPNVTARTGKLGPPFQTTSSGIRRLIERASSPEHTKRPALIRRLL